MISFFLLDQLHVVRCNRRNTNAIILYDDMLITRWWWWFWYWWNVVYVTGLSSGYCEVFPAWCCLPMDYVLMCMYRFTHDAVYLYLLTVNQTLAEGYSDYRDGHLILNKTIGQRFVGRCSTRNDSLVDKIHWVISLFGLVFRWVLNSDWDQRSARKWSRFFRLDSAISWAFRWDQTLDGLSDR